MLHSTLPRAFLPPGLNYLSGYYGDDGHVYSTATHYIPCLEDPCARITDRRIHAGGWEPGARARSPSPLDLSLKPPPACEAIEVDEVVDEVEENVGFATSLERKSSMPPKRSYSNSEELSAGINRELATSEIGKSSLIQSYHGYADMIPVVVVEPRSGLSSPFARRQDQTYTMFEGSRPKNELAEEEGGEGEPGYRSHNSQDASCCSSGDQRNYQNLGDHQRKLHRASPSHSSTHNHGYNQQLLLTPQHHLQAIHAPMTPPSTPSPPQCPRRRTRDESDLTPSTPSNGSATTPKSSGNHADKVRPKKKHARRLKFDEDTSSPVSGTVILGPDEAVVTGDIDPAFNIVEVTEEARAELAKIENRLGPYQCKLCRQLHEDAFQLAQHRCSRIAHVEYRCPECDKRFSCPANLASHRRWHKPRMPNGDANPNGVSGATGATGAPNAAPSASSGPRESEISCTRCDAKFTRATALRKHLATQHPEANNNSTNNSHETNSAFDELNASVPPGKPLCPPINLASVSLTNELP